MEFGFICVVLQFLYKVDDEIVGTMEGIEVPGTKTKQSADV